MRYPRDSLFLNRAPAVLWALVILVLLMLPGKSLPSVDFWSFDKFAHAGIFFVQSIFLYIAFTRPSPVKLFGRVPPVLSIILIAVFYAVASELLQGLTPDRKSDILDAGADCAGALLSLAAIAIWRRYLRVHSKNL